MSSIELPRDAEGREIPLNTTALYDKNGQEIEVSRYQYYPKVGTGYWNIRSVRNKFYRQDEVYLTKPDSWEKLLDDLDNAAKGGDNAECLYSRREGVKTVQSSIMHRMFAFHKCLKTLRSAFAI